MKRALAFLLLLVSMGALAVTPGPAPSPGGLDPSFGRGGLEFTNLGASFNSLKGLGAMALQPDGKIVVAGSGLAWNGYGDLLARFNGDGTLDASFNSTGYRTLGNAPVTPRALALQSDGKIVLIGANGNGQFTAARFNPDGSVDTTFNGTGGTTGNGNGAAVAIQADGRIVVAGDALVRYNADGSLDTTFGNSGIAATSFSANALALQPDGKIVVGGSYAGDFAVARYNANGTLDTTFNGSGTAINSLSPNTDVVRSVAIAPDGKIVAAGQHGGPLCCLDGPGFGIARYNTDGTLDTTFNGTGMVYRSFGRLSAAATSVAVLPDGRLVVAGTHYLDTRSQAAIIRLMADGTNDPSFSYTGRAPYGAFGSEGLTAVALQADGKVVAAGTTGPILEYVVLRVQGTGTPDASFGRAGYATMPSTLRNDTAYAVAIQSDGRIVAAGSTDDFVTADAITLARYATDGRADTTFGAGRASYWNNSANSLQAAHGYGLAIQGDGRIVVAGDFVTTRLNTGSFPTSDFVIARFNTSGFVETAVHTTLENFSTAKAVRLQPDSKILAAGFTRTNASFQPPGPKRFALARYNTDLSLDAGFNGTGKVVTVLGTGDAEANALAIQADGTIIAAGTARNATNQDWAFVIYTAAGAPTGSILLDVGAGSDDAVHAMAIQPNGAILVAGSAGNQAMLARFTSPGFYDNAFAEGGKFTIHGAPFVSLALQPDGKIVALTHDFHVWRFTTAGVPDTTFGVAGRVALAMGAGSNANAVAVQADGKIVVVGSADGGFGQDFVVARIDPATAARVTPNAASLDFGGQSMNTTSPSATLTFTAHGPGTMIIHSVATSGDFAITSDTCIQLATLLQGYTCQVSVTFTPRVQGTIRGTLLLQAPLSHEAIAVTLVGQGERSLVTHYYRSILRRDPDAGGKAFWESEAARVSALGANVNETWYAMAQAFFFSAEYAAFNRANADFATDLYSTFFNRAPDSGGLAHWAGQLDQGMPREVLLAEFMFSAEFRNFTQAIFGAPTTRAEVNAVTDFYRGLLGRLPDGGGFNYWLGRFRAAQCQGSAAVTAEAEAISSAFALSGEYAARGRNDAQYVGDLYNAFLRRGGDLGGVQHWINEITSAARTREQVRVEFRNSPEFQARVNAIIQQGCLS